MHTHPADPGILAHCVAVVRANNEADGAALMRLAEKLRFGDIRAHSDRLAAHNFDHRLVFFLVHFDFDTAARRHVVTSVRQSGSISLSFAPVVLFLPESGPEAVLENIDLGFDDVILVPQDGRLMATRLAAQIGQEHLYIETRNYLGPDRHRLDRTHPALPARKPEEPHARLTILRTVEAGVQIVRRQEAHKGS